LATHDSQQPTPLMSRASNPLRGRMTVPGDKSISHRAVLFGALATGVTRITGLLEGEDVRNTARAVASMGVSVTKQDGRWEIRGRGVGGLTKPTGPLDFGNAGTGVRLMMGVLAGHPFTSRLVGDASLSRRPMGRVLNPLKMMGLAVEPPDTDHLPLEMTGLAHLVPIVYELPVPSAQVKSAVLLAGLHAPGTTTVIEHEPTRDHTERMLRFFGAELTLVERPGGGREITIHGQPELTGRDVIVPADPSSAAFPVAAAAIVPGSEVTVEGVLVNETRTGFYTTLQEMGADLVFENERNSGGERIADIRIRHAPLHGVTVPADRAPSMIDEYPMLACVAAFASGETVMEGLAELKVKESDRLAATYEGLTINGVAARVDDDTLTVTGAGNPAALGGGNVATHLDHRIAMAFLTMGLATGRPVTVDDGAMIATSFPTFIPLMTQLGARIERPA